MAEPQITDKYSDQLRLLSIFHYIFGALTGFMSCIPIIHIVLGIVFVMFPDKMVSESGETMPAFFGWIFVIAGALAMAAGWAFSVCAILAGRYLVRRRKHLFCIIVAAISCLFFPLGTVLGVFTLIIITKPEVKALFN
ncbi:MAG: hypothetical protein JXD21_08220 [Candidatus Omnitrophica bacterium]|nr:hypothetical protein [Candidatus Omnitrophota bacterium]